MVSCIVTNCSNRRRSLKGSIIVPIAKGPYPPRIGPGWWADWRRGCLKAVSLQREYLARGERAEVLILCDAQYKGGRPEAEYYQEALTQAGAQNIRTIIEGRETVRQVDIARALARAEDKYLVVVSTWLHYPRVAWLLRGSGARHVGAFGIPHWRYACMDIVLNIAFPLIDLFPGGRARFLSYTESKRIRGEYL